MMDYDLMSLPVLSIRQPWAWLIANGLKDIENRDWSTKFRGIFLIHAGKKPDDISIQWLQEEFGVHIPSELPLGGIVGLSKITDCVSESSSEWFFGMYGFVLDTTVSRPLPFVPCKGRLGFFQLEKTF